MRSFFYCFTALTLLSSASFASPITANVVGSTVGDEGDIGMEYRNGYEWDDDSTAQDNRYTDRVDFFYNMTDDAQFRVFLNRVNPGDGDSDFSNIFIEPSFQVFHAEEDGFDGAFTTGLTLADGDDGAHQFRTILTGTIPFSWGYARHNSIFAHEFGHESVDGLKYEARWRAMHYVPQLGEHTEIGVEMFNDFTNLRTVSGFDEMTHRAGPVAIGKLTDKVGFQTGVLAGLSKNAPDAAAKFWLSYDF